MKGLGEFGAGYTVQEMTDDGKPVSRTASIVRRYDDGTEVESHRLSEPVEHCFTTLGEAAVLAVEMKRDGHCVRLYRAIDGRSGANQNRELLCDAATLSALLDATSRESGAS